MQNNGFVIRPFREDDQAPARELILAGLREHWGDGFDPNQNPDLDVISKSYEKGVFLVALAGERLVGTGALIPEGAGRGRILRMSVATEMRRQGVGIQLLKALCERAKERGYNKIVLETTSTWEGAQAFYRDFGFKVVGTWGGDTHFERGLGNQGLGDQGLGSREIGRRGDAETAQTSQTIQTTQIIRLSNYLTT